MRRRYPRNVFPYLDYDYLSALSPSEREWLVERFSPEYYNAEFPSDGTPPLHTDEKQRRELGLVKRYRVQDVYERGLRSATVLEGLPGASDVATDLTDPAANPNYKAAVSAFRSALPPDGRKKPSYGPEFIAQRSKIAELAGAISSEGTGVAFGQAYEEIMAKNRLLKLQQTRANVWNIGCFLSRSSFPGSDAPALSDAFRWLETTLASLDAKLKDLGIKPPGPGEPGGPQGAI